MAAAVKIKERFAVLSFRFETNMRGKKGEADTGVGANRVVILIFLVVLSVMALILLWKVLRNAFGTA